MPELPEVETVMRGMRTALEGGTIASVRVMRPDLRWPFPPDLARIMTGRRILSFRRRGKYILMRLSDGWSVLLHLGMSGRVGLTRDPADTEAGKHEHLIFMTREGVRCGLTDPRRFGAVDLIPTGEEDGHRLLAPMGPEPLGNGFSAAVLEAGFAGRRQAVKVLLLDQRIVAGIGNIYACEALYCAEIHPERAAASLSHAELVRLTAAVRAVLEEAIAAGGSSLRDYVQPDGELGYFQHAWQVYGRSGEGCAECPGLPDCGGVRQIVQGGRSTFFCPQRQKLPSAEV
ncbi:bifunctional DNA-formamidopyrimidine glycosylase/DNA-(apurinic or apyrimidinic site) lyase [Acetobacter sp. AN02]|uniref:bifunctional DNA-formamidopyrimidine glycosylase/DNA-(apurinic or apyrimidinic site) lyase n=1 Tax=Acetobacter sp. AN02 TaxID=2894186 RepID=UPI0024341CE7|nr:bifunctional DNA-formamidopyrimidine glycosylase/DNA-(apurinic or apyrimidinic site) lyase [Acetobacter sp. AN02]MDG6095052.1 bifunctional DNA-formamidopyrimidine glycosylase/DNA-(apurinic or apyrimidinic site) lyase [Acetobacter sp. AN02]